MKETKHAFTEEELDEIMNNPVKLEVFRVFGSLDQVDQEAFLVFMRALVNDKKDCYQAYLEVENYYRSCPGFEDRAAGLADEYLESKK